MAKAVLIDEKTVAVAVGSKFELADIGDLDAALTEKTDIGVVPCEVSRVVAASEDSLQRQLAEVLPEGSVNCFERIEGASFQVFSMPEHLLQTLRSSRKIRSVIPYAFLAREGRKGALSSFSSVMTGDYGFVTRAGRAFLGGDKGGTETQAEEQTSATQAALEDYAVVDIVSDRPVITTIHGQEIRGIRALHPDDAVQREIFVTLQGNNMPNAKIVTHHRKLGDRLSEAGRNVEVVRLPASTPTVGLHGLRKTPEVQFYLPAEVLRIQRRAVRRKLWRSVIGAGAIFAICLGLAVVSAARRMLAESELLNMQAQRTRSTGKHAQLFRERYGSLLVHRTVDIPQAWAELEMVIPPQLWVTFVQIDGNSLKAFLTRRNLEDVEDIGVDVLFVDPPISTREVKRALTVSPMWRGADIKMVIEGRDMAFMVEKTSGTAGP